MAFVIRLAAVSAVLGCFLSSALAVPPGGGAPTPKVYFEQGILTRSGEVIDALGPNLMGDAINEYSGGLEFTQADFTLPGNNALPVSVGRHLVAGSPQTFGDGHFGNWELEIPRLHTVTTQAEPNWYGAHNKTNLNRCSQFSEPPITTISTSQGPATFGSNAFWDGYHLYVPGAGDQTLLRRATDNTLYPSDGTAATYPVVTKNHWQLSCLPTLDNAPGEGFLARSPDGTSYRFDHIASRAWPRVKVSYLLLNLPGSDFIPRAQTWLLPTLVTDRFGNWVRYTYGGADGSRVSSITSSDGRSISFSHSSTRIQSATDGTRTWNYGYSAAGRLQTVTQPDASTWTFALDQLMVDASPYSAGDPGCDNDADWSGKPPTSGTITHPSGAVGTFVLNLTTHGRSGVPGTACNPLNKVGAYFAAWSMTSKTLSGPGMPAMSWNYAYSAAAGSFRPCNGCTNTKTVTITDPLNNINVNTYGTQFGLNEGLLLSSVEGVAGGSSLRSTSYTYNPPNAGPYPTSAGNSLVPGNSMSGLYMPQSQRAISQQGVTFTQTVTAFDGFARATSVTKGSSLGFTRNESTTYFDQISGWILGQVAKQTVAGLTPFSMSFDSTTALPTASYKFGKLQATYGFNSDGTLSSITDGLNHTTTYASYKRGLPQLITNADGTTLSAAVNTIGNITSLTNEIGAGSTWTFGYDAMGRLAARTPPGYNPTFFSFEQVASDEYGLGANHWRQTITTGNAVTVNYFDARWRKRITITYDAANQTATQRMQRFDYNPYNRTTFASYPARSIASIATPVNGSETSYDPLGRVVLSVEDSELGQLTTRTDYLSGFQKRVTNPRNNASTTTFQVFDEPSESAIATITAPEGVGVQIQRDVFDKPLSITRGGQYAGGAVSATRRYVYDSNQLLCKTVEPEIGATIQRLDAANNVAWRATGLGLVSTTSCDWSSTPAAKIAAFSYDARNRITGTGFGDGTSPSIGRSYTRDGLPSTVVSNGSTWTYGYDGRRLLKSEQLALPSGSTWTLGRAYDGNANLSQLTYPDGVVVAYSPDALGEPLGVGGYASGVSYHPNGMVASYTLANGVVHTLTQNTRGLPLVNSDAGILRDEYSYDANGSVSAIVDLQQQISSRSMGYDGLDRLKVANAPAIWGSAIYTYDPLDNLRTSVVGARASVHDYDANNRLSTINTNGAVTGYVYDTQGNIVGRGTKGYYFDQGNRMQLANGAASYVYDGLGRRVMSTGVDGSVHWQMYSQGGQLVMSQDNVGSSITTTRYVYLGGKSIAQTNSATGATTYLHTDVQGSVVATVGDAPAVVQFSCPSGWTLSGNTCTQAASTIAATVGGYSCPSGYALSGSSCSQTSNTSTAASVTYNCPAGWSLAGTNCSYTSSNPATPVYTCPGGFALSGTTCSGSTSYAATKSWDCKGQGSLTGYAASPSGYYCVIVNISASAADGCPDIALSRGFSYAGVRPSTNKLLVQCLLGPVPVYACPSGATLSGSTCTAPVSQAASVSGYTCPAGTLSGSSCVSSTTNAASVSYDCPAGQSLSGPNCIASATSTTPGTPIYTCPSGYTVSGSSCGLQGTATAAATVSFNCPTGGTLSGSTCLGVLKRTRYEAYGNVAAGSAPLRLGYTGHVNDADTGLVYMQQRYYDPIAARFLSVDPITTDANTGKGFGLYEYVQSNPYRYTDPDGRAPKCAKQKGGCSSGEALEDQAGADEMGMSAMKAAVGNYVKSQWGSIKDAIRNDGVGGTVGRIFAAVPGDAAVMGVIGKVQSVAETTTLFRAVSAAEAAQIAKTGAFEAGRNSLGGKWFALSAEHAQQWGDAMNGIGKSTILQVEVATSAVGTFFKNNHLDNIGPAVYGELEQLRGAVINVFGR
jgi:RHS repeat-associated protein